MYTSLHHRLEVENSNKSVAMNIQFVSLSTKKYLPIQQINYLCENTQYNTLYFIPLNILISIIQTYNGLTLP